MQSFTKITSKFIPLPIEDVDTDMIIPAQFLTSTSREGFGEHLFERLRQDPAFPLNDKAYEGAQIIVARDNFGCGSSREHAVWALLDYGIRVVVAPSFADIFFNNSAKNGLVLVQLPEEMVERLLVNPFEITVDLTSQTVTFSDGSTHEFSFDPFRKECILNGHDELDYLIEHLGI